MFRNYLKITFRNTIRNKGYTFINVSGLAIGLACCIIIMLWVTDELSFDKYHKNYNNLYRIVQAYNDTGEFEYEWKTYAPLAPALKADFPEVTAATRFRPMGDHVFKTQDNVAFEQKLSLTDPEFFSMFSFPLLAGDSLTVLTTPGSIVITEAMAQKYFGNENPVGKSLKVDNKLDLTITGVIVDVPKNSHLQFDCLAPFVLIEDFWSEYGSILDNWQMGGFATYVLLNDHTSANEFNSKLEGYLKKYKDDSIEFLSLQPLNEIHLYSSHIQQANVYGNGDIKYVYIFSIIAILVLVIACINFMNLTTARSCNRAKEVGLRKVVGSVRGQIIRQFFGESILLSFMALLFAVLIVELFLPVFNNFSGKNLSLSLLENPTLIVGLSVIALLTGLFSGTYPALFLSSFQPVKVLKGSLKVGGAGTVFRKVLVVGQFTISILLIISTLIISKQLDYLSNKNLGFEKEQLAYLKIEPSLLEKYESMKSELLTIPEIVSVTITSSLPTHGIIFSTSGVEWEGKRKDKKLLMNAVSAGKDYIETFQMNLLEGRFPSGDTYSDTLGEAVLNETAIKEMELNSPVGKMIKFAGFNTVITGVVKDYYFQSMYYAMEPMVIISDPTLYRYLFFRINSDEIPGTMAAVERVWNKFAPDNPYNGRFLNDDYDNLYRAEQRMGTMFNCFTMLAIFISCLGLLGLAAYMTEQRTREIGVRKVLGASVSSLVMMISREFVKWILISNILAWPMAYMLMKRWLESFAYRTSMDWRVFVVAGFVAVIIALLTVSFQALKAALTDPVKALKHE